MPFHEKVGKKDNFLKKEGLSIVKVRERSFFFKPIIHNNESLN